MTEVSRDDYVDWLWRSPLVDSESLRIHRCVQPIASGEGLVAVGAALVEAAATAGVELPDPEIFFARVDGSECWIGVAPLALYGVFRIRLAEEARAAFDEALGDTDDGSMGGLSTSMARNQCPRR